MCVVAIVDANKLNVLATKGGSGDELLLNWIKHRHGVLAFSTLGRYFEETRPNQAVMELIRRYEQGGQLRKIAKDALESASEKIEQNCYRSNDPHVLALALASDAQILCSDDGELRDDFRNRSILSNVNRRQRVLYPSDGDRKRRRSFLNRHRCGKKDLQ